jgi:hypothetical protein
MRAAWSCLVLAGCFYAPNSFRHPLGSFTGKRVSLPCLDVAVTLTDDDRALGPVVAYSFGNRCLHAVPVNLAAVRVVAKDNAGNTREVAPYDPKHEIVPLRIDALWSGAERIEYPAGRGADTICVDLARLDGSGNPPPTWICLAAHRGEVS